MVNDCELTGHTQTRRFRTVSRTRLNLKLRILWELHESSLRTVQCTTLSSTQTGLSPMAKSDYDRRMIESYIFKASSTVAYP